MNRFSRNITCAWRNEHGVALIEFVIVLPFLFLLLFGGVEVTRMILIQQRLERVGYVVADMTTQYSPATSSGNSGEISVDEINRNIFPQMTRVMAPYDDPERQAIIISSIRKVSGKKIIQWQIASVADTLSGCDGGAPDHCVQSEVSGLAPAAISEDVQGMPTKLPADKETILASMPDGENLIVTEVFYRYEPLFRTLLQRVGTSNGTGENKPHFFLPSRIYSKSIYFAPRNGVMLFLPPRFPAP